MAKVKKITVPDFEGGLFTGEPTLAKDNQVIVATNMFYNDDKILQTRRGQRSFGGIIPDAVLAINEATTTTNWAVGGDGANLTTGDARRGANSVSFDIDVSVDPGDQTTLTNASIGNLDITDVKDTVKFYIFVPTGFNTNLTSVKFRLGTDSSNYYEWTLDTLTENDWNSISLSYDDATETGTVTDTNIDYVQLLFDYAASYTDKTGILVNWIYSYSGTNTKPMLSLKYFESTEEGRPRYLITNVGENLFEYEEESGNWIVIKTGLTEDTRFGFNAYKNVMYLSNGYDNYMSYDGTIVTEHTGSNTFKGRFMLLANDVGFIAGMLDNPTVVQYTDTGPTDLNTYPSANIIDTDRDDNAGIITGMLNLGPIVIVFKERKTYQLDIATPSFQVLDYSDGGVSDRSLSQVENSIYFLSERGQYTLAQRQALTESFRATPLTDDITALIKQLDNLETTCGIYVADLKNVYLFGDTNNDLTNDACIVRNLGVNGYTTYDGMNVNEVVIYKDSEGQDHILAANSIVGQMKELEYGTNDNGNPIAYSMETKEFDFGEPQLMKTFETVEVQGFISEYGKLYVKAYIDDEFETTPAEVDGQDCIVEGQELVYYLGGSALGTTPLGGGGDEENKTTFYPFIVRFPVYNTGFKIKIRVYSEELDTQFMVTKATIYPQGQAMQIFPTNYIK